MGLVLDITGFVDSDLQEKLRFQRTERYAWQSVAKLALPDQRVSKCLRQILVHGDVEVYKHLKTTKAFYGNLVLCGSVWLCPVCAAKISERRREELKKAFDLHIESGGFVALLTLTFSHKKNDRLIDLLSKFTNASEKFRSGKRYAKLRTKMDIIGSIRAFEITYGQNGFHPHTHILLFYTIPVDLDEIKKEMYELWEKATSKFGLKVNEKHGLDLQNGQDAHDYLAKHGTWGLDREMTKSHIKRGKMDEQANERSLTPFDFLRLYLETEEKKYLQLFREYGEALKGKRQLSWSQGLKQRFFMEEKSDEELAKEKLEEADLLGFIEYDTWKYILKNDMRSFFLDQVEKTDFHQTLTFVKGLKDQKKETLDFKVK